MNVREAARSAARAPLAPYVMAETTLELSTDGDRGVAHGWLDPAEPFLADHRPGGNPLLGTVGGLEVLAAWIAAAEGAGDVGAIEGVEAIRPIAFEGDAPREVIVRWRPVDASAPGRRIVAELSTSGDGGETVHVRCVFVYGPAPRVSPREASTEDLSGPATVGADDIYRVFFHGPTFRVVARAELRGATMVSELASPLPRWSSAPDPCHIAPRLIEFGLQTAGLLQLALDGEMMIPRHIGRVDRHLATDVDRAPALFAVAERAGLDPSDPIDIRILDADGAVHLDVLGYRCVPLPFATDNGGLAGLAERLRNSRRDHPK